eukprot:262794-Pelagomonas_calceolata.AAC.3
MAHVGHDTGTGTPMLGACEKHMPILGGETSTSEDMRNVVECKATPSPLAPSEVSLLKASHRPHCLLRLKMSYSMLSAHY